MHLYAHIYIIITIFDLYYLIIFLTLKCAVDLKSQIMYFPSIKSFRFPLLLCLNNFFQLSFPVSLKASWYWWRGIPALVLFIVAVYWDYLHQISWVSWTIFFWLVESRSRFCFLTFKKCLKWKNKFRLRSQGQQSKRFGNKSYFISD